MPPSFTPRLINDASGDPGLFVPFSFQNRAFVFDLGDIYELSPRDILKISHIFISHTHMDHFIGFDRLLRIVLGREKILYLFGPKGFLSNLKGKLGSYCWNLVKKFSSSLIIHATEITEKNLTSQQYICQNGFLPAENEIRRPYGAPLVYDESGLTVSTLILDHGTDCLGFALKEKFRVNIRKDGLEKLNLVPGKWLNQFKQDILENTAPRSIVQALHSKNSIVYSKNYIFEDLAREITLITKGQKIAYIADAAFTPANVDKMVQLAENADQLFIESAFLEKDIDHAQSKHHLTARQAGEIAGLANVKQFTLFHFSPRYKNEKNRFYDEAMTAYSKNRCS